MFKFERVKARKRLYFSFFVICILTMRLGNTLSFRADQFTDVTERCKSEKKLSYVLSKNQPAMYISIDPNKPGGNMKIKTRKDVLRHDEIFRKFFPIEQDENELISDSMKNFIKFGRYNKKLLKYSRAAFTHILKPQKELKELFM